MRDVERADAAGDTGGQPVGAPVPGWTARARPPRTPMIGRYCDVVPLDARRDAVNLHEAFETDVFRRNWTYLPVDPPADFEAYENWLRSVETSDDPQFYAIVDRTTGRAVGVASYLRIDPGNGVIEVGHLNFSPWLQQTRAATDAMFLMMRRALAELGYRRYEWKCDSLNAPSRAAAQRLGFQFEGIFRQALVYKGRNRDTAWFSILDREWPALEAAFEAWLDPSNFDEQGRQKQPLRARDIARSTPDVTATSP